MFGSVTCLACTLTRDKTIVVNAKADRPNGEGFPKSLKRLWGSTEREPAFGPSIVESVFNLSRSRPEVLMLPFPA